MSTEHLDVLVVGAGISGIGAGRYLKTELPAKTFAILDARGAVGGTWDLFRYPGIRSDSDLHTFGYAFKPWRDKDSIADAPKILSYLEETVDENGLAAHLRLRHQVLAANWSSADARWLVDVERTDPQTGGVERLQLTAGWIFCGSGYYRYDEGYTPHFEGRERFSGEVVHPQAWPEDLEYDGRRVVVIGSGATAVTLVPALAERAAHVTMLQRTPTYVLPVPREDRLARPLKEWLGEERAYPVIRRKNVLQQRAVWLFCQRFPRAARRVIRTLNARQLPEGYPVDEHFDPPYDPWDQRLCVVPDGDLFRAIRRGTASIVTDRIRTFTERGLLLDSGKELEADVVVTATGLNLQIAGGIELAVDGRPVRFPDTVVHRGTMLSGVPNFCLAIGYTNASWTLKVGLLCEYFCRLLAHMDAHGHDTAWAEADPDMPTRPLLDFDAGYVKRSLDELPRQGPAAPWVMSTSYFEDRRLLRADAVTDEHLHFSGPAARAARAASLAEASA
ncbi:MAG TPA: NAD(P)/FAD-dependent oxidoreductase [Marmoricola sp.]|nr:NAD(P)/FAD-dependent oxidoreductase [Marmoricola sp.]